MKKSIQDGAQDLPDGMTVGMAEEIAAELGEELGDMPLALALKHLPAVPSVREVRALLDSAKDEPRDYLLLRLLYYTGIRRAELAAIRIADVSYDDATIFIRGGKGPRSVDPRFAGVDRYVCVDARTLELVRKWQGERPVSELLLGIHSREIDRIVNEYGKLTGLVQKYAAMERSFSPHSLRHAYATHRYDEGMDLLVLKKLLGHRNLTTTEVYIQTSMRHTLKQYRKTDPLRGK